MAKSTSPPRIAEVTAGPCPHIVVTWTDGTEHTINLATFIAEHPILDRVTHGTVFATVAAGEGGWSVGWSDETEICVDALWSLGLEQEAARFRSWRKARGLTQAEAGKALGLGTRTVTLYEAGAQPIPKTVLLACIGYDTLQKAAA